MQTITIMISIHNSCRNCNSMSKCICGEMRVVWEGTRDIPPLVDLRLVLSDCFRNAILWHRINNTKCMDKMCIVNVSKPLECVSIYIKNNWICERLSLLTIDYIGDMEQLKEEDFVLKEEHGVGRERGFMYLGLITPKNFRWLYNT